MPRATHETDADIAGETAVAQRLEFLWKGPLVKQPPKSRYDWTLQRDGRDRARIEIKRRGRVWRFDQDAPLMLSLHKWSVLQHLDSERCPSLVVVEWPKDDPFSLIYFVRARPDADFEVRRNTGRTVQTRDRWDREDCVFIPASEFKPA